MAGHLDYTAYRNGGPGAVRISSMIWLRFGPIDLAGSHFQNRGLNQYAGRAANLTHAVFERARRDPWRTRCSACEIRLPADRRRLLAGKSAAHLSDRAVHASAEVPAAGSRLEFPGSRQVEELATEVDRPAKRVCPGPEIDEGERGVDRRGAEFDFVGSVAQPGREPGAE